MLPKEKPNGLEGEEDGSAKPWFANWLGDDACASMVILTMLLNMGGAGLGKWKVFVDGPSCVHLFISRLPESCSSG